MPCTASIEWICSHAGVARLHPAGGSLGDPFTWSATLARDGDTVTLKGVAGPLPPGGVRALNDELYRHGVRRRSHTRAGPPRREVARLVRPPRDRDRDRDRDGDVRGEFVYDCTHELAGKTVDLAGVG